MKKIFASFKGWWQFLTIEKRLKGDMKSFVKLKRYTEASVL